MKLLSAIMMIMVCSCSPSDLEYPKEEHYTDELHSSYLIDSDPQPPEVVVSLGMFELDCPQVLSIAEGAVECTVWADPVPADEVARVRRARPPAIQLGESVEGTFRGMAKLYFVDGKANFWVYPIFMATTNLRIEAPGYKRTEIEIEVIL